MEEFHETYRNLRTCLSCPRLPRCFFFLKELCDAWAHCLMYLYPCFSFFRSRRHVLHIENLSHIFGWDEWVVCVTKILEIHCCHSVQLVDLYPIYIHVDPTAPNQRDLKIRSVVKSPYLIYVTIVCVLCTILVCCIKADTTILVGALLILGDRVKCIPIYLVPLESQYSLRRYRGQQVELISNSGVMHET